MPVNELSNTIDLPSTLIRAEALFRRFQRTVETIDKKSNFPAPKLRQRPISGIQNETLGATQSLSSGASSSGSATGVDTGSSVGAGTPAKGKEPASTGSEELQDKRERVISSELRGLLSRKVAVLPRKEVQKKGEGVRSVKK